jgi:hypothetical protein
MANKIIELEWHDIKTDIDGLRIGTKYWVTVYNQYWIPKVQSMEMEFLGMEFKHGTRIDKWKCEKIIIPKTWEVTHWMERPAPAWEFEE